MRQVFILLYYDLLSIKAWFRQQAFSKLLVLLAFILVSLSVSVVFFVLSNGFFFRIASYKQYGDLTALYLVHSAIIITSWFAFATATISTFGLLRSYKKQFSYLLTQPLTSYVIPVWLFIKSTITNSFLLLFFLTPIAVAYAQSFMAGVTIDFITRFAIVFFLLVLITNSLATICGYKVAAVIKGKTSIVSVFGLFLFFGSLFLLADLIFPHQLVDLYNAPSEQFFTIYNNLPLSKQWLPTSWMLTTLISGFNPFSITLIAVTVLVIFIALAYQTDRFIPLFQSLSAQPYETMISSQYQAQKSQEKLLLRFPLIGKDWLSIRRVPSESGYALFLFFIALFFFLLLSRIEVFQHHPTPYQNEIVIFSYVWLLFFTTAFLLRLIYPLMAEEGSNAWYIFTQPVSLARILFSKLVLGFLASFPLYMFAIIVWLLLPFSDINRLFLITLSLVSITTLAATHVLLGTISPNFSQADDPEKISTSAMGVVTLVISMLLTVFTSYLLYSVLKATLSTPVVFFEIILFALFMLAILYTLSTTMMKKYEF